MTDASYRKALEDSKEELQKLIRQRDEINDRIARTQAAVLALAHMLDDPGEALAELEHMAEIVGPTGLTSAVTQVIRSSMKGMTAVEVRDALVRMGLDLSKYSNGLAAVHTTLKRLKDSGQLEEIEKSGEKAYRLSPKGRFDATKAARPSPFPFFLKLKPKNKDGEKR